MTQVEAAPRSVNYWMKLGPDGEEESVTPGRKITIMDIDENSYTQRMVLRMEEVRLRDFGTYICIARNSLGDVRTNVQLQGAESFLSQFIIFLIENVGSVTSHQRISKDDTVVVCAFEKYFETAFERL